MVQLFDAVDHQDDGPPDWWNSPFPYLNRSARTVAARVREFYEASFDRVGASKRKSIWKSFRSPVYDTHLGAAAELQLLQMLARSGFAVEISPIVMGNLTPDFRVRRRRAAPFLIEAKAIGNGINPHLMLAFDAIDRVRAPTLRFHLRVRGEPTKTIGLRHLREKVQRFADAVSRAPPAVGEHFARLPKLVVPHDGGRLELLAAQRAKHGIGRNVGTSDMSQTEFLGMDEIRSAVRQKAKRYKGVGEPLVVALLPNRAFIHEDEIEDALLGNRLPNGKRATDGVWRDAKGPRARNVSAVLVLMGFAIWPKPHMRLLLVKNPWAEHPLEGNPFGSDMLEVVDGQLRRSEGKSLGELLRLPKGWPGEDD